MYKILILFTFVLTSVVLQAQDKEKGTTLDYCIQSALNYNPSVKIAELDYQESLVNINTAASVKYPSVSSNLALGYSDEYHRGDNYQTGNAAVSFNQVIWQHNRINAAVNKEKFSSQSALELSSAAKKDLILAVKTAFYQCIQDSLLYETYRENTDKSKLFLQYARGKFEVGMARKTDITKAESDLTAAEYDMNTALNELTKSRYSLSLLTGIEFSNLQHLVNNEDPEVLQTVHIVKHDSMVNMALESYPLLNSIKKMEQSQQENIKEVRSSLFPVLMLTGGYDWNYTPLAGNIKGWYGLMTLRWDIFSGFEKKYRLQAANIRRENFDSKIRNTELELMNEVNTQLINLEETTNQIILTQKWLQNTLENLQSAEAQYKAGTGSMLELADARVKDLNAKQNQIRAITAWQITIANIERLTGKNIENAIE